MCLRKSQQPPVAPSDNMESVEPSDASNVGDAVEGGDNGNKIEGAQASVPQTPAVKPGKQDNSSTTKKTEVDSKSNATQGSTTQPKQSNQSKPSAAATAQGGIQPYHAGFFKVAEKDMPATLKNATSPVRSGLVIDLDTNTILWQKDAGGIHPIASLTKLMTALLLMEHLETHPAIALNTMVEVTADDRAYFKKNAINGVYLDKGESYSLREYLMCMMVASANDCAYVVGRYISGGDPAAFVLKMNERAKALGLKDMHFNNANGLPIKSASGRQENTGSALSIAYLALCAMRYSSIMECAGTSYYRLRADKKNPFDVNGTNKLIRSKVEGVNGLKTGYTDGAGYCIVVTCERGGKKRMVLLMGVGGADRGKLRDSIAKQLLEWSYK
ncbi:MAG: serine hydrolase [Lentisphaeria bacterium]|nr:serine hydrolase [Lentisphaeria bacterium]